MHAWYTRLSLFDRYTTQSRPRNDPCSPISAHRPVRFALLRSVVSQVFRAVRVRRLTVSAAAGPTLLFPQTTRSHRTVRYGIQRFIFKLNSVHV